MGYKTQSIPNQEAPAAQADDATRLGSSPTDIAVTLQDLSDPDRLLDAFHAAVDAGIVRDCDQHLQLWFEAACHAVRYTPKKRSLRGKTAKATVDRVNLFRKFVWQIDGESAERTRWWKMVVNAEQDEAARWRKAALEPVESSPSTPAAQTKPRIMPARLKLVMNIAANAIEDGHDARGNIACIRAAKALHLTRDQYFAALDEADAWFASNRDRAGVVDAGPITDAGVEGLTGPPRR
jgi:hypothetical protein